MYSISIIAVIRKVKSKQQTPLKCKENLLKTFYFLPSFLPFLLHSFPPSFLSFLSFFSLLIESAYISNIANF